LTQAGFVGWQPWSACPAALDVIDSQAGGIYVVYHSGLAPPTYLDRSPAGTFRGDPSVPRQALDANWVPGARVVYIGKANHGRLRKRLEEFADFGRGGTRRHWGGRLIWQLDLSGELLVAWQVLPREIVAKSVESQMIATFRADWGKAPFANDPHRLGL
jgi:hypothetical protein